jgi:hypothetical protein
MTTRYNSPSLQFVTELRSILDNDRVFWINDNTEKSNEIIKEFSKDQSRHQAFSPEVVCFPKTPGIFLDFIYVG